MGRQTGCCGVLGAARGDGEQKGQEAASSCGVSGAGGQGPGAGWCGAACGRQRARPCPTAHGAADASRAGHGASELSNESGQEQDAGGGGSALQHTRLGGDTSNAAAASPPKHFPLHVRGAARARAAGKWGSSAAWGWFCGPEGKLGCQGGFKIFVLLPSAAAHPRRQTTSQAERGGGSCSAPTPRGKPGAKHSENGHKSPKAALSWVLPPPEARRCRLLTPFVFPSSREARRLPVRHRLDGRYLF